MTNMSNLHFVFRYLFNTDAFDLLPPDRSDNETSQTFPRDTDTDK